MESKANFFAHTIRNNKKFRMVLREWRSPNYWYLRAQLLSFVEPLNPIRSTKLENFIHPIFQCEFSLTVFQRAYGMRGGGEGRMNRLSLIHI